ncbi:hypothetical protein BASA50_009450 [Batrachochytrium salamandrivorans]|uniref:Uncharacterized protein n=1 Tax=Batrachochytrium salamandrivorans TaxID=1357716 RepID=A0ABQ8F104_9FUNG|nr:hypothetical protein BASA62_007768 [Batrachochytrium salamandrivorans]KAH6566282.1 hypothetical protein BASA60_009541 [Batrachochytrium salamandrivorans]KAH6590189.1 hypothetical protein BASA50_009450 [Batrachochytrium salamandrivorans]KAH9246858.1 hypothetical protein BASA81_015576 [Batrachochytrium salamandrivorans]
MKLVSFAVVSFLAVTVSAGFSANLGNADYSVHQLEKRGIVEDMQRQLAEKTKRDQKNYEDALGTYNDMMRRGEELETELFEADLELRNLRDKSQKDELTSNRNMARAMYESQQDACHLQYKTMMNSKKKLYENVGELLMWKDNQQKLKEHNRQHPNDLWKVTPPAHYNKEIMSSQVSAICNSIKGLLITEKNLEARLEDFYYKLVEHGSNKEALREHSNKIEKNLERATGKTWAETMVCAHTTTLYRKMFGAQK